MKSIIYTSPLGFLKFLLYLLFVYGSLEFPYTRKIVTILLIVNHYVLSIIIYRSLFASVLYNIPNNSSF